MNQPVYEYKALADYNAEVSRGVAHTPEYVERMRLEQERFDQAQVQHCVVCRRRTDLMLARGTGERIPACIDCFDLVKLVTS